MPLHQALLGRFDWGGTSLGFTRISA